MEAYCAQMEEKRLKTLRDDEAFAKKLSEEENRKSSPQPQPVTNGNNVWVNGDDDEDIALKISKEKLLKLFPGVDASMLMQVYKSSNYNFDETVSYVQDSLLCTPEERKQIQASKKKVFNTPWKEQAPKKQSEPELSSSYTDEQLKTVDVLRQEIADHQDSQKVLRQKVADANRSKQFEVAAYYNNVAQLEKQHEMEKTHAVGNLIAVIHEKTHGTNSTTLDLHFHSMIEAQTVLDNFLDKRIEKLRAINRPYMELQIITGKGTHSTNGMANIKIQTKNRLKARMLK